MSNIINCLANEKMAIDRESNSDRAFWIYTRLDVNNSDHLESVSDLVTTDNGEGILSFVVFDKLRRSNVDLSQFQDTNSWFGKLKEKYSVQIDEFIAKNSGELVDLKKDNKKKEKNPKQAEPKKVAPAAPKKEHVAKKKEEISEDYKNLVKSLRLKRVKVTNEILPVADKKNVLITAALPYVNNVPHLGNLIGAVLSADVFARFSRLRGWNTLYICGTDEYGTATEFKAVQEKKSCKEICDHYNAIHNQIYEKFDIDFDEFNRTTTEKHKEIAQDIFLTIQEKGLLEIKKNPQFFCDKCELPLADRFIRGGCPHCPAEDAKGDQCDTCGKLTEPENLKNPQCAICSATPNQRETEHFYINLATLQPKLEEWIKKSSEKGKWTNNSIAISKTWLKEGLRPRCITRDLKWGVQVPVKGYENKVFYVWFDAPIGYISITANYTKEWKQWWQNPDNVDLYQFMGKDNVPFHTVVFPSTLIATDQNWTMLHHISTTEYLQYEDTKFSKSRGTGVFGDDVVKTGIPIDVWRYYLLINRPEGGDSYFKWEDVQAKTNNELLPNPGNLVNRVLNYIYKNKEKSVPMVDKSKLTDSDLEFLQQLMDQFKSYVESMEAVKLKEGLKKIMEFSSSMNKFMQDNEVWAKDTDKTRQDTVLNILANGIKLMAIMFEPFMPGFSAKLYYFLGFTERTLEDETSIEKVLGFKTNDQLLDLIPRGLTMNQPIPIFERIDKVDHWRTMFQGIKS